ncbi:hypothetical protein [Paenibacillus durus]|uniref:hypothetical protein n=1 Tax=Paenibacillus durus TaxID=44251 RepID=UPI000A5F0DAC|nr:hypothetical protein [Paenibacillus durus]
MPNLISILTAVEVSPSPSRACTRASVRNRRALIKSAIWTLAKASAILLGVFVREVFL